MSVIAQISNVLMADGTTGEAWAWMQMWSGMYCIREILPTKEEAVAKAEADDEFHAKWMRNQELRDKAARQAHARSISPEYPFEMLDKFDGGNEGIEKLWAGLVDCVHNLPTRDVMHCGGHGFSDTPAALYRILWLARPDRVDFSDMYKQDLLVLASRCRQFFVEVSTFKYELSLYFYCTPEHHVSYRPDGPMQVYAGSPDADNGHSCTSEIGRRWFDFIRKAAEMPQMIYGGNHFEV